MPAREALKSQRLFFALWPEAALQEIWANWAQQALPAGIGRLIPAANLHITLFFLGDVAEDQQYCVENAADGVHAPRFNLCLERLGYWRRPQVAWLSPQTTPFALQQLVSQLQQGLERCGFKPDPRPYQAHLTLARKVRRGPPAVRPEPVAWPVDRFVLVRSELNQTGSNYEVIRAWPLD
ncbi:MAG: RNA 2',3'-cyclic phosphodiesterase [Gammaproteobacteria bacterium]|nr:RNA 2',3'-cyclic phosphodiesterase [Gammaproteobacteria bacterium]